LSQFWSRHFHGSGISERHRVQAKDTSSELAPLFNVV
jgi:hypothetical protein